MTTPTRVNEDGDLEKQCSICKEWWYADSEFFEVQSNGHLRAYCKACGIEMRYRLAEKPCKVPGCPRPRYGRVSTYCREHHYEIHKGRPAPKPKPQKARKLRGEAQP